MKNIPDEHEYTQNPVAREFHKENLRIAKAQDTPILDSRARVDDLNLEVVDSQIQIKESNYRQNFETKENEERTRKISIPVEETSAQKVQDIHVIHVTIKENDLIFQISAVDEPHYAQVINEFNRDLEARDSQDYICEELCNLDSAIHEEAKESSLEDYVELSLNMNPKEDPSLKNG
ncbi:hypothetical protein AMTRI_Chr01g107980 [Amborella trichopoda]